MQINLLKAIINTPGIFSTEAQRAQARKHLFEKMKRRDRKVIRHSQLKINIHAATESKD